MAGSSIAVQKSFYNTSTQLEPLKNFDMVSISAGEGNVLRLQENNIPVELKANSINLSAVSGTIYLDKTTLIAKNGGLGVLSLNAGWGTSASDPFTIQTDNL